MPFKLGFWGTDGRLGGLLDRLQARPSFLLMTFAVLHYLIVMLMRGGQILYVQQAFSLIALLAGAGVGQVVGLTIFQEDENHPCLNGEVCELAWAF